jgi:TldD protein
MIENWDLNKVFRPLLSKGAFYADIFVEDTEVKSLTLEDNRIEKVAGGHDTGVGLRAIKDLRTRYAYTNELKETSAIALSKEMAGMLVGKAVFSKRKWVFPSVPHKLVTVQNPQSNLVQKEADVLYLANEVARGVDPCVRQVRVVYRASNQRITVAMSNGEARTEQRVSTVFMVHVVAQKGDLIQTAREQTAEARSFELLSRERVEGLAVRASERAVRLLDARPAPSGPMTVVLSSKAGGTMVHEAVGHGLEADLAQEGLSVYSGMLGQKVAAAGISIIDDATIDEKRGSFCYDDEGTPAQRTVLVENGLLKGYLYDKLTAMKDGALSTGNGRRESYRFSPIPRMTNIFIAPGKAGPEQIISSVNKGLLVVKMGGGQVDTVNGNFVFEVSEGYLLKCGRIGDMVRGATLIGNGPQIIKEIDMVGHDLGFDVGTCGKDGQGVPVSDAQPTVRIPLIVVGGTERQE